MKQSRLFPALLVTFMAIVLVGISHLSAAVIFWDDFDSAASSYYNSVHHWEDNSKAPMSDLDEFNTLKILWTTDSVQLHWNPDEIHGQDLFHDIHINEAFNTMPDELITMQINSRISIPNQLSELGTDMQSTSKPADDIVFKNGADFIKSMRTPAPGSLLLVALGLLSLRFTRWLRY